MEGEPAIKVDRTGTTFVVVEMGEECAVGEAVPITGSSLIKDCEGKAEVLQSTHLVAENDPGHPMPLALGHPAKINGSALVEMASNRPWSWLFKLRSRVAQGKAAAPQGDEVSDRPGLLSGPGSRVCLGHSARGKRHCRDRKQSKRRPLIGAVSRGTVVAATYCVASNMNRTHYERKQTMRSRFGLKALGLCALLVGLLAIPASAQAAGKWMDETTNIEGTATRAVEGELENNHGILLANLGVGLNLELLCTAGELVNANLEKEGKISQGTTKGKVKFTGCIAKNGGAATACEPHSAGSPVGTIETVNGHALAETVGGVPTTKILPSTGTTFVVVQMGEECAFGEEVPVTGSFLVIDCEGKAEVSQPIHLIEEAETPTMLFALNHEAFIDGSALIELANGHSWSWLLT